MKNETFTYPFLYSSSEIYKFDFQQVSKQEDFMFWLGKEKTKLSQRNENYQFYCTVYPSEYWKLPWRNY